MENTEETNQKKNKKQMGSQPGFPGGSVIQNLPANAVDAREAGSVPERGTSPGGGNGNPTPVFLPG